MENIGMVALPKKPNQVIEKLIDTLIPYAQKVKILPKSPLAFLDRRGKKQCYLLVSGRFKIIRNDKVVLGVIDAPMVLGLNGLFNDINIYAIQADKDSLIYKLDASSSELIIDSQKIWKEVAILFSYNISVFMYRDYYSVGKSAYAMIRKCLIIAAESSTPNIVNIPNFIVERTALSRSMVMVVLRELKKGGFISLEKGRNLKINKLPENF